MSYAAARWKVLFSLATRYCLHALRALGIGLHVSDPVAIVESIHAWNRRVRPQDSSQTLETLPQLNSDLQFRVLDLKSFFPSVPVPEFIEMLNEVEQLLRRLNPTWTWF